jgi:hypothetical protein
MTGRAKALDDRRCRVTGGERNNDALTAPGADIVCTDDRIRRVVAAFHDDVGAQMPHELERCVFVEYGHGINRFEPGENVGAIGFGADRPLGTLQAPNAGIAVEANDECITARPGAAQHIKMARMKEIKDAVREDNATRLSFAPRARARPVKNLPRGIEVVQKVLSTRGSKWISRT